MIELEKWRPLIQAWAKKNHKIDRVYIFGSRAKGSQSSESDLDIVITLREGFGYVDWFDEFDDWATDLQNRIDVKIHLCKGGGSLPNETVEEAIRDHGLLIYSSQP